MKVEFNIFLVSTTSSTTGLMACDYFINFYCDTFLRMQYATSQKYSDDKARW